VAGTPYDVGSPVQLVFSSSGVLTTPAAGSPITFAIGQPSDGAAPMSVNWNPWNADGTPTLTQFDQSSATSAISQDGAAAAQLTAVSMGSGGQLLASYTNGQQSVVGQLAMANIQNPQTLVSVGNNNYEVSADTGAPAIGAPGTGGRGTVVGGALESSNVDMATELTNLIVLQSAYQANSKVVTTVDTMAQAATQLIT
jgi:flagellar hook protein FlgE